MPDVSLALWFVVCGLLFGLVAHHLALALRSVIIIISNSSVFLPQCVLAAVCSRRSVFIADLHFSALVCLFVD